ncbi:MULTISPECIES: inositol monophosphatase family protein [Candidatus Pelagibacter]|uniref:inositol monophosphatase family protein n=1 Tax=Candidatus Pelagibacter TaxID=198251 RepID=UPI00065B37F8|nr:inositol monophosphatase family protein [Candidatus Pelagibacter ubique]
MNNFDTKKYPVFSSFLNQLAKDLTKFYYAKLDKPFKITNKMKGKGYDPVTTSDKAFEKFIRSKISKRFPDHQIIGEEYGHKNTKSEFSWVIDPIDGTRSYVVGNPSWSNLISLNYNGEPILGLANFPKMKKYYLNVNKNTAYVFENNKKRKLKVNSKLNFANSKLAAAFHNQLTLKQQSKIQKFIKRMQFPCFDALTYCQLAEGRLEMVAQCANKIWDIHPIMPIVRASGAIVTTWGNRNPVVGGNIIVSNNKANHKQILKLLKPLAE